MRRDVNLSFDYPHAPAKVWRALTEPALLAQWLMENDFQAVVGHEFSFRTKPYPGFDGVVRCKVLALEAPKLLSYSWAGGGHETVLTFTLAPLGSGTRLTLAHTGFEGLKGLITSLILGSGWKSKLLRTRLPAVLAQL
jgi:uncharacterized protein YndB with AHSA1/START domain